MAISFALLRVLDPTRIARRLLWHVLSIGTVSRDEPEEHAGMDKAGLFLFRVKSGGGTVELPSEHYVLAPGTSWWLLDLARPRRYVPSADKRLVTMSVRFSGPGIDTWREEVLRGRAGLHLPSAQHSAQLRRAYNELKHLASGSSTGAEWRMHEILTGILGVLLNAQDPLTTKEPEPHSPTRRVIEAVQANPLRDWHVDELVAIAGTSYSSLRKSFKASQDETLHAFLQRTRLEQARWRLTDMRLTVKAIALQLNFSSEFYFSRWFHTATGLSPSRFRAMLRG